MYLFFNEVADRLRVFAYHVKVFGQVQAFDESVDHKGAERKPQKGIKPCLNVEYEEGGYGDEKICGQQCVSDIEAGVFLHDHSDYVRTSAGRPDIEEDGGADGRQGYGKYQLKQGLVGQRLA